MGIYTESIIEKERQNLYAEQAADAALEKNVRPVVSVTQLRDAQNALGYILESFGLEKGSALQARSVPEMLDCILDPLCIMYEQTDLSQDGWKKSGNYILAFTDAGNAIVLKPKSFGYGYYLPSEEREGPLTGMLKLQEKAYTIIRPLLPRKSPVYACLELILRLLNMRDLLILCANTGLIALLGLCIPAINRWVLNDLIPLGQSAYNSLIAAFVLYLSAGILSGVLQVMKRTSLGLIKMRICAQFQAAVMAKAMFLPQSFFQDSSTGKVSKKIANSRRVVERTVDIIFDVSLNAVFSLVYIPQMARLSPALASPALVILAVEFAVTLFSALIAMKNEEEGLNADMDADSFLLSSMRGIQKIKSNGAERRVYAQWAERYRKVLMYTLLPPGFAKWKTIALAFLKSAGTIVLIAVAIPAGVSRAEYIAFTAAYSSLLVAMRQLMEMTRSIFLLKPLMQQVGTIISCQSASSYSKEYVHRLSGSIDVEHVSFHYPEMERKCLDDVSIKIRRGEKIALVGESGCGKSTLLKLLLGMETPTSGSIYFDGMPMETLNLRSLRKRIGSVFQFSKLIPDTLYANIAFSDNPVSEEEVWDAVEKAALTDDIRALPLGLDTEISQSSGGGFSGGQKQRILLARAFASKAPILILDEATSALDNITQKKVLDHVYASKATVIMVAHRLSTVVGCDRILMLENGKIVEQGSYQALLDLNGKFAELVRKQLVQ